MYIKKKCAACGLWTIYEVSIFCRHATETCTHCRYSLQNIAWDSAARQAIQESNTLYDQLCEKHPELRELKVPGDHMAIDEK